MQSSKSIEKFIFNNINLHFQIKIFVNKILLNLKLVDYFMIIFFIFILN